MSEKKYRVRGILATLIIHAAVLVLLIIFGFTTKLPLPEEEGVEVNLGNDVEGFGEVQLPKPSSQPTPTAPQQASDDADLVTQDLEETPFIEDVEGKDKQEETVEDIKEPEEKVKEQPKVNPNALYKGNQNNASNDGNEGDGEDGGDKGKMTGVKDSDNYDGNADQGSGLSFSLKGRKPRYLPKPSQEFEENGTVVVQITVNQYGKVIKAVAIAKGSNTTNTTLRKLAEQAAMNAQFDAKPDAPEIQRGTITYHFKVRN